MSTEAVTPTVLPALEVDPDLLWADDPEPLEQRLDTLLLERFETKTLALSIAGPATIVAQARDRLPIVGLYTASLREAKAANYRDQLLLVAVCVETREVVAATAFAPLEVLDEPNANDDDPGEGMTGLTIELDAFERLGLPRDPGTWLIRLILREQQSNAVRVRFVDEPGRYRDVEVERFLAAGAAKFGPTKVEPPVGDSINEPWTGYGDDAADAPEPPFEPGIVLSAPRVFLRDGSACVLHGSFRLRARLQDLVDVREWREAAMARRENWDVMVPNAVLQLRLLITGADTAGPRLVKLALPSYDPLGVERTNDEGAEIYTGRFALDLETIGGLMMDAQTCFLYAFAGEVSAGPVLIGVVTPSMLPNRKR